MGTESIDPNDIESLQRQLTELQAKLTAAQQANVSSSGAAAQGGGDALGERSVKVDGENSGPINTGTIVNHYHAASDKRLTKEQIGQSIARYLHWLRGRTESIELRGIERAGGARVLLPLETAYVPLRAKALARVGDAQEPIDVRAPAKRGRRDRADDTEHRDRETDVELNEVLGLGNRLVIIGGPGCGKTTVLLHMAWALASSLFTGEAEPAQGRLGLWIAPGELPLPIFVPLASFARYRRNLPGNASARERTLSYFISYRLISKEADFDLPDDFFAQMVKDGRDVILLLDGLDEVANENQRAEVRESVGRDAMRVVVTCRTIAYRSGRTALGANFREIAVQRLDPEQHIAPMVRQAYACIYPHDAALRGDRVQDLLGGIQRMEEERRARLGKDTEALVGSPLMVRLLLIVHVNNRTLPNERADLFDKAINALLQVDCGREESDIRELSTDWKLFRDMAQHLALHMHQQGCDQGREIEEPALKKTLRMEPEFQPRIDEFLSHARERGSVLEERDGTYRFIHLAFQEFMVARYLSEVIGRESREAILAFLNDRLDDPWWREPILLLVGYMDANAAKSARDFLAALAKAGSTPNAQFAAAELAGTAVLEWRESGEAIRSDCVQRIVDLLEDTNAMEHSAPVTRARSGDALSQLGDLRFDPERFYRPADDRLGFVHIPADPEFKIGTRKPMRSGLRTSSAVPCRITRSTTRSHRRRNSASHVISSRSRAKHETPLFAVCINNTEYPASLELHNIYRVVADEDAAQDGDIRVVDESGEDYLYPANWFAMVSCRRKYRTLSSVPHRSYCLRVDQGIPCEAGAGESLPRTPSRDRAIGVSESRVYREQSYGAGADRTPTRKPT